MTLETMGCTDDAVYWEFAGHDKRGDPTVSAPIEIQTRWEKGAMRLIETDATPVAVHGMIMVDRELRTGSILWHGSLDDLPDEPTRLVEVVDVEEIPDVKGEEVQRNVRVRRWKKPLPEIV